VAARLSLGDLVGHAVDDRVVDPGPAILPPGGVPALESLALRTRPDLVANLLTMREDEELERANKNLYYPTLGVFATYEDEGYRPNRPQGAQVPYWAAGLSANWTIYDGGLREGQVAQADATRRQAAASEHQARQDLHRDVAIAASNLATQQEAVNQAQVSLHVAEVNDQETRTRYSQGLATQLDVSDANSALFGAKVSLIAAQVGYANARYTLRQLVGWWPLQAADPHPSDEDAHRQSEMPHAP
jgi:outer membrane protein TolC